ncbi:unnamed protein product [Moneuplotes crassus]|uniref:Uncharacterized protein n=1 Tax=Euplotes crassus TaxID=5936 RepID=A0AAD1UHS1_EUPCR|nr:unnamed protein product [Moneuplotes crassus]
MSERRKSSGRKYSQLNDDKDHNKYNEGSCSTMERSTFAKQSTQNTLASQRSKNSIFGRSDVEFQYQRESDVVRENLFEDSESYSPRTRVKESNMPCDKYDDDEIPDQEGYSRSSDTVKPSYLFQVNTRIWRNHLRLNYGLRACLILSIALVSLFTSFVKMRYERLSSGHIFYYNVGPIFLSVNGTWHFIAEIYNCQSEIFPGDFCGDGHYKVISIAAAIYNFGVFLVLLFYIASLIFPKRNIDRLNWLGLSATFLGFTCVILIGNMFRNLSHGFYFLIVIIIVAVFTQSHFLYSRRKQRKNSLTNQLLEA